MNVTEGTNEVIKAINRKITDYTMTKRKRTKVQTMIYKTLHKRSGNTNSTILITYVTKRSIILPGNDHCLTNLVLEGLLQEFVL